MRMWQINPKLLCRKHLIGEHGEIHKFRHCFEKKHNMDKRILLNQIEPASMQIRHDELAKEMLRREFHHNSPYTAPDVSYLGNLLILKIDTERSYKDLIGRCPECLKIKIEKELSMNTENKTELTEKIADTCFEISGIISSIQKEISKIMSNKNIDLGSLGNLNHVKKDLQEILNFLKWKRKKMPATITYAEAQQKLSQYRDKKVYFIEHAYNPHKKDFPKAFQKIEAFQKLGEEMLIMERTVNMIFGFAEEKNEAKRPVRMD